MTMAMTMDLKALAKLFLDGGPVMWPILGLSVIGLAILFWQALELRAGRRSARGLVVVSTIITAEPMLGILGTVTGIIQTFGALKVSDAASPLAATAGIGEALITTAAGLIVTLILVFPYNFLLGLLAKATARLEGEDEEDEDAEDDKEEA